MYGAMDGNRLCAIALGNKHTFGLDGVPQDYEQAYGLYYNITNILKALDYRWWSFFLLQLWRIFILALFKELSSPQWHQNEFESGGHRSGAKVGAPIWREAPENFFGRALHFLALKVQLVVLVSAFVMASTVWSVSCLLFFYSRCPHVPRHL